MDRRTASVLRVYAGFYNLTIVLPDSVFYFQSGQNTLYLSPRGRIIDLKGLGKSIITTSYKINWRVIVKVLWRYEACKRQYKKGGQTAVLKQTEFIAYWQGKNAPHRCKFRELFKAEIKGVKRYTEKNTK